MKMLHVMLTVSAFFILSCGKPEAKETAPTLKKSEEPEKKPTPKAVEKNIQTTILKSGEKTTSVIGSIGDLTLFFAGDYVATGSPFKTLLALGNDGKIKWTYATGGAMGIKVTHSNGTLLLKTNDKALFVYLDLVTGKAIKSPEKFEGEGISFSHSGKECNFSEGTLGCTFDGSKTWEINSGNAGKILYFDKNVCFVGEKRTIFCHDKMTGSKSINVIVPVVAGVKNPNALNFTFVYHQGALYVGHYDGSISIHK